MFLNIVVSIYLSVPYIELHLNTAVLYIFNFFSLTYSQLQ